MEKIIVFTPTLNIGGIERVLLTYAKGLAAKGYDVTYLTCSGQGDFDLDQYDNVQFVNLNVIRLRKSLFALINFFRKSKPDVIFTANDATLIVFLAKLLSGTSAKLITSHHNYYENNSEVVLRQKLIIKYIYPLCHRVIAVSNGIRLMLLNKFNIPSNKVEVIYNPVDISEILRLSEEPLPLVGSPNDKYVLYVGRLSAVKNLSLLCASFKIFHQFYPDVKLLIIGDGNDKEAVEEVIDRLNLGSCIFLIGVKSNPFPYIKSAKVIVLSSTSEALPTVLLESLVLGKTIASTPTLGAKDILKNGKYGYISNSLIDANDFYQVLKKAYEIPFDSDLLYSEVMKEYNLSSKIVDFEKLWKVK